MAKTKEPNGYVNWDDRQSAICLMKSPLSKEVNVMLVYLLQKPNGFL